MQKRIVSSQEEGRSLGRYLEKQLPRAPKSLLYKLLRTKAVKVNGKRVQDPKYSLSSGDQVEILPGRCSNRGASGIGQDLVQFRTNPEGDVQSTSFI
ncbi:MAG: S4 domain-containing protein [Clostridia bacterium]